MSEGRPYNSTSSSYQPLGAPAPPSAVTDQEPQPQTYQPQPQPLQPQPQSQQFVAGQAFQYPVQSYPQQSYPAQAYPAQPYPAQPYPAQQYPQQPAAIPIQDGAIVAPPPQVPYGQSHPYNQPDQQLQQPLNPGQHGHIMRGQWSDGVCDCFNSWSICCLSFFISPYRWAKTMSRVGFNPFNKLLLIYGVPWFIVLAIDIFMRSSTHELVLWASLIQLVCVIVMVALGSSYRTKLRAKYDIPGSELADCALHCFCQYCAIAQEGRHVDRDFGIPI